MKKHTKIYYQFFGYGLDDFVPCELTGLKAVDINHIDARGMGGSLDKDHIDNLMAVVRNLHLEYGDKSKYKDFLKQAHQHFKKTMQPYIDENPHHKAFDELLKFDEYNELIKWKRNNLQPTRSLL